MLTRSQRVSWRTCVGGESSFERGSLVTEHNFPYKWTLYAASDAGSASDVRTRRMFLEVLTVFRCTIA